MNQTPSDIQRLYVITMFLMILFSSFIIFIVVMYNRNQLLHRKEKQLQEAEYQNQLLQKELERQKSIQVERARISHDMHDDLGAGISALKLQTEFLQQKLKHDPALQQDLQELLKTSADMNLSMRQMLWNLNKANDTLHNLVKYISSYAEQFFCKAGIDLNLLNQLSNTDVPLSSDARWHLFLCVKEALNNIYKHSKAKNVCLIFNQTADHFILEVEDNGIGLSAAQHGGNGFKNMHFRMQECCGKLDIIPSPKGLHLRYYLPV